MPFSYPLILLLRTIEVYVFVSNSNRLVVEVIFLNNLDILFPLSIRDREFDPIFIGIQVNVLKYLQIMQKYHNLYDAITTIVWLG